MRKIIYFAIFFAVFLLFAGCSSVDQHECADADNKYVDGEGSENTEDNSEAAKEKRYPVPAWLEDVTEWKTDQRTRKYFTADGCFRFRDFLTENGADSVEFSGEPGSKEGMIILGLIFRRGEYTYQMMSVVQMDDAGKSTIVPQFFVEDKGGGVYAPLGYLAYLKTVDALDNKAVQTYNEVDGIRTIIDQDGEFMTSLEMLNNMFLVFFDERDGKICPFDGLMQHYAINQRTSVLLSEEHQIIGDVPVIME